MFDLLPFFIETFEKNKWPKWLLLIPVAFAIWLLLGLFGVIK